MRILGLAFLMLLVLPGPVTATGRARFFPLEVLIDAGAKPLAAYQFEFVYPAGKMSIVGIEGGDAPFAEAPFYDPRGLTAGRVVIAAFTIDPHPPAGRVRVARIHLMAEGDDPAVPEARLVLAADPDGEIFPAEIRLLKEKGDRP